MIRWGEAVQNYEGKPGTRSYLNNNPFDFRFTPYIRSLGATGRDAQNFAKFPTFQGGFNAGLQFLRDARANLLIPYRLYAQGQENIIAARARANGVAYVSKRPLVNGKPICLLGDFFEVFAPASDSNVPTRYATNVALFIGNGVSVETPINLI